MRRPLSWTAAVAALALVLTAAPATADPGPPLHAPEAALRATLVCHGDLAGSAGVPVLLVHGTGVTADQNWEPTYRPELQRRGHAVCTVQIPDFAYGDVQGNVEYVVAAIREMHRRAGRKISIIGHSQGGFLPYYALKVWPDLAADVDDFIGVAGAYGNGSAALSGECASASGCTPAFTQLQTGSTFLQRLAAYPTPAGPSLTAIATLADDTVTPQPRANELPGGRSIQIQDLCPGRSMPGGNDHIFLIGDAVAHALILDALGHPGPADPARITAPPCDELLFPGVDYVAFATLTVPGLVTNPSSTPTTTAPPLRCALEPTCADVRERGAMLAAASIGPRPRRVLRLLVQSAGRVTVTVTRNGVTQHTLRRTVSPGRRLLTLPRPPRGGRVQVRIATRPVAFTADAVERTLRWPDGR